MSADTIKALRQAREDLAAATTFSSRKVRDRVPATLRLLDAVLVTTQERAEPVAAPAESLVVERLEKACGGGAMPAEVIRREYLRGQP